MLSRDSAIWWVGLALGIVTTIVANIDRFTFISSTGEEILTFVGLILSAVSMKMATSPLPSGQAAAVGAAQAKIVDGRRDLAKAVQVSGLESGDALRPNGSDGPD